MSKEVLNFSEIEFDELFSKDSNKTIHDIVKEGNYIDVDTIAAKLGFCKNTIYNYGSRNKIRRIKVANVTYYHIEDVHKFFLRNYKQ